MPELNNVNGDVSYYGFACGYVQRFETDTSKMTLELYGEGCVYQVRHFYYAMQNSADEWNAPDSWRKWDSFDNLKDARKRFAEIKRNMKRESKQ